jgi:hypothetical protein
MEYTSEHHTRPAAQTPPHPFHAAAIGALVTASVFFTAVPAQAADQSICVNFSVAGGSPTYRASGWIYGMTEDASAPANHCYRDVKFRYMRARGAQLDSPGGWVSGKYDRRWNATLAQLLRTRSLGGQLVLLVHDLWGADGYPISRFPGDSGDWTDHDNFFTRLINDVRATGAPVEWDIWDCRSSSGPHTSAGPPTSPYGADRPRPHRVDPSLRFRLTASSGVV